MTIYKTEARIYSPKIVGDADKSQTQSSQPLQECHDCTSSECRETGCDCQCDCEAQPNGAIRVMRRQSRPCSTWALGAICTVTVGLCFLLAGLLYMATRPEFRKGNGVMCNLIYPPDDGLNMTTSEMMSVQEEEEVEVIDVPEFKNNHHITIMADFKVQVTAIRDNVDQRCFLMNHSNSLFESPSNLLEFMRDYKNGAHLTQLDTIYARMEVQGRSIDMTVMATSVQTHCFTFSTFWLHTTEIREVDSGIRDPDYDVGAPYKRSVDGAAAPSQSINFFNGKKRVSMAIYQ